jgi:predicted nucleic acid-binding protein
VIRYVDTSAALKLLVEEAESAALAGTLDAAAEADDRLVASFLLATELHCAARRRGSVVSPSAVTAVLDGVLLVDLERSDLLRAASSEWGLRSADAIHLATALRLEAEEIVTYDVELTDVARRIGLSVNAPR